MKKFISALTSLVITATALGGTAAFSASAINEKVDTTIIDIRSGGKNEIEAKAGDTIKVDVYIPQSAGINSASGMFAINDGQPTGKDATNPYSFNNYGFTLSAAAPSAPNALNSGYATYLGKLAEDWDDEDAADAASNAAGSIGQFSAFYKDTWSFIYMCEAASNLSTGSVNADAYGEYIAKGVDSSSDYKNFTPAYTWDDKASWAYEYTWMTMTVNVPADVKDGTYVLDLYRDEFVNVASRKDKYEWEQDPTWNTPDSPTWDAKTGKDTRVVYTGKTGFTGASGDSKFDTKPLTIKIGEGGPVETTAATTAATTAQTTAAVTTDSTPAVSSGEKQTTPPIPANTVAFDLIARGMEGSFDGKQNVFNLEPADEARTVKVDWIVSSDGVPFAGVNYEFAFSEGIYKNVMGGNVFSGDPTYDVSPDKTKLDIVAVSSANMTPAVGAKVATFNVTIPAGEGTYTIDLVPNGKAATVDYNAKELPAQINTIKLVVGGTASETTAAPTTTTTPAATTTTPAATTTASSAQETTTAAETTTTQGAVTTTTVSSEDPGDILYGDVNCDGKVSIADVVLLNKGITNADKLSTLITAKGQKNADVDKNNKLDTKDSTGIKQFLALIIDKLPIA